MTAMPTDLDCFAAVVVSFYDGDTFHARFSPLPNLWWEGRIRLARCNAPEMGKAGGPEAALMTRQWLAGAPWPINPALSFVGVTAIRIRVIGADNYGGRLDCEVWRTLDGRNLSSDLLATQHAVPMAAAAQLALP